MSQALKVRFINFVGFDVVIFFTARIRLYHSETTPLAAARFVDSTRSPSPLVENPTANPVHVRSPHAQAIDIIRRTSREDEPEGEVDGKDATGSHVVIHGLYETRWKSARTREGTGSSCIISEGDSVNPLRRDTGERRRSRSDGSCRGHPRCAHFR